ncbi:unnamed protein product [Citrullus colocynthis]|uniref:Retrotransposon Copia-like N-terminal domain-containing protein n=1 Tax=Citrullus colocynthis TaxID=252529 RepID=A0ABP0Z0F5_9ROSI
MFTSSTNVSSSSASSSIATPASGIVSSSFGYPLSPIVTVKLDEKNYLLWTRMVLAILRVQRVDGFVLGTKAQPPEFTEVTDVDGKKELLSNPLFKEWKGKSSLTGKNFTLLLSYLRELWLASTQNKAVEPIEPSTHLTFTDKVSPMKTNLITTKEEDILEITLAIMATTTTVEIGTEEVVEDLINLKETSLPVSAGNNQGNGVSAYIATPKILNDPKWLADSGATSHVTVDASNVNQKATYNGNETLTVGNKTRAKDTKRVMLHGMLKDGLYQLDLPISKASQKSPFNPKFASKSPTTFLSIVMSPVKQSAFHVQNNTSCKFPFPTTHTNSETISSSPSPAITSSSSTSSTPTDVVPSLPMQSAASFSSSSRLERSSHDINASVVHIDEISQPPSSDPPISSDLVVPPI